MKKKDNNKPPGSKPQDKETADSINNGKKAIEVQKKTASTNPARQEKESKDDAEKWRNEG